jgi:hypothetical protein
MSSVLFAKAQAADPQNAIAIPFPFPFPKKFVISKNEVFRNRNGIKTKKLKI